MSSKKKSGRVPVSPSPSVMVFPKELKIALLVAIPFGITAALILSWSSLFPVPAEKLVEVVWKHECSCASNWMKALRAEGFVVRDFELDDLSISRKQWHVPDSIHGCHPAYYMGYFLDGHFTAETLHRLARELPKAAGIQQVDDVNPDAKATPRILSSQLMLIDDYGAATLWAEPLAAPASRR